MDSSRSQKSPEIAITSVGHFNEAYPNTYFKSRLLLEHYGCKALAIVFKLSNANSHSGLGNLKLAILFRFVCNNLRSWIRIMRTKPIKVYVCYPGIFLVFLLKLTAKRYRPSVYLDAFISIYDTVVIDRKLISEHSILAKILFKIERAALLFCDTVIVDTAENASHMAAVFSIPQARFQAINLTVPVMSSTPGIVRRKSCTCLFIGTFVPLQGIECIAQAAGLLGHRTDIHFKIIGDGQDSPLLRSAMRSNACGNITWIAEWLSTTQLQQEIANADICLGIFGTTEKSQRVWPFKNYLYMAAGKPIITGDSNCARNLATFTETDDFVTSTLGCAQALADSITTLAASTPRRAALGSNAKAFYQTHLSHEIALRKLTTLLDIQLA
ncbi:MAG: glycosyltransferase involved in cell wall biosynthesis [Gammaproteobacteria bacterium]|jgi:glycosyltransferase involved in cell wall biosynthesis